MTTVSLTCIQFPLLVELNIRVVDPAASSATFGVYKAFNTELLGLYVPPPPLQIPEVVPPETEPERTDDGLFLQILKSSPAFTTGDGV